MKDSIDSTTSVKWNNIKVKSEKWPGLNKFGLVFEAVFWNNDPNGCCMHQSCYQTLCNTRACNNSIKSKGKLLAPPGESNDDCPSSVVSDNCDSAPPP